jgi:hypothetical protein
MPVATFLFDSLEYRLYNMIELGRPANNTYGPQEE